ncbi:MAG: succinate dehydrogenase, hydrophobic membrane anchor protein [Alphaproteobacteria bacterium]|nr:succinate dehydrogenase, hydrophobic membrane anchor protein [Alphaproteobacteria bacterium]
MSGAGANGGQNGAAESGVSHWWGQRLTAILLVPLALWFTASFVTLSGAGLVLVRQWIGAPVTSLFLAIFMASLFRHIQLGLEVVVDDYVHGPTHNRAATASIRIGCILCTAVALLSILVIYLDGRG